MNTTEDFKPYLLDQHVIQSAYHVCHTIIDKYCETYECYILSTNSIPNFNELKKSNSDEHQWHIYLIELLNGNNLCSIDNCPADKLHNFELLRDSLEYVISIDELDRVNGVPF